METSAAGKNRDLTAPALIVISVSTLPWLLTSAVCGSLSTAVHLLLYAVLVFAVGYWIASLVLPSALRIGVLIIAPALGILAISGIGALTLRLRLSISWLLLIWVAMALPGAWKLWADQKLLREAKLPYGWALVLLAPLVCCVFSLPSARNDAVLRSDGSFNWIYEDTQHFSALTSSIARDERPPRTPGTDTAELRYHFGPYVPAATISKATGLDLGHSLVRVTRGAAVWALLLSCFGVGSLLSLKVSGESYGGMATAVGFFFYGSLAALFTDRVEGSSPVKSAVLFNIDGLTVPNDGGPFSHLILGSSLLPSLGAITAIMGLSLVQRENVECSDWRKLPLLVMPALAVAVNSLGGLYCLGVVLILLFWGRIASLRSLLFILVSTLLLLGAWSTMGYFGAPDTGGAEIRQSLDAQWVIVFAWFLFGLGFRSWALRWLSRGWKDPVAALVLVTFVCFLSLKVVFHLRDNNEKYGLYFLQCIFSIFAFSQLPNRWWRARIRSGLTSDWLQIARAGALAIALSGAAFVGYHHLAHHPSPIHSFARKVGFAFVAAIVLSVVFEAARRKPGIQPVLSSAVIAILFIGFLGWVPDWLNYGRGRMRLDITLTPGEVRGLLRLHDLDAQNRRFATNKHANDTAVYHAQRSYGYTALSQRPALLEGYLARGETYLPGFSQLLEDNELMFATSDPEILRNLARKYDVAWLVARPGTDIAMPKPLPSWLVPQEDCGDLKVYHVSP